MLDWISRDAVVKFLCIFYPLKCMKTGMQHYQMKKLGRRQNEELIKTIQEYYYPTKNLTLKNYQFCSITQGINASFAALCNRTLKEAKHCKIWCNSSECTSETIAVRDQIIIGISSKMICLEDLMQSWNLDNLRREGMTVERALHITWYHRNIWWGSP